MLLTMLILRIYSVPYVLQTHGMLNPRYSLRHRAYDLLLTGPAARGATIMIYLTSYELRQLRVLSWCELYRFLPNAAVDVAAKPPQPHSVMMPMEVVVTCRLHPRKRVVDLVNAVALARERGVKVNLAIYGPDAGDLKAIRAAIHATGSSSYVRYGGALRYGDVKAALRDADVFVLPSEAEPFPYSLMEAMSEGLACVCTTACGLADFLSSAQAGVVVEPGAAGIAEALERLEDPRLRLSLGQKAIELCRKQFALSTVSEMATGIYLEALEVRASLKRPVR